MAVRTYGSIVLQENEWIIEKADPHVCIKLKSIFPKIPKSGVVPFKISNTSENCLDLSWFMERYPLQISRTDNVYFLTSDAGSDPLIIDLLGLKASQSAGIVDPMQAMSDQYTDESRIKQLAKQYLPVVTLSQSELFNTIET